jgi:signal transduction histidine kinase
VSLRQKLLLMFSLTVIIAVAAVAWTVSLRTRQAFGKADQERTSALVDQFRREFQRRADDVALRLDRMAGSDRVSRMAFDLGHNGDPALYLTEATALAQEYELDYLEIVAGDGSIISSAQWPARFGYKETALRAASRPPFLKKEELPSGAAETGLFAVRTVHAAESPVYLVGGKRLDREFLSNLPTLGGTQLLLYRNLATVFDPRDLVGAGGDPPEAARYGPIIMQARTTGRESNAIVYLTSSRQDSVYATAIPLLADDGSIGAVLVVANSRRGLVELQQHIRAIAYSVAAVGILLAIAASLWIAARISRPVELLAAAAAEVAAGNWDIQVQITSHDEVGRLADTFNRMTRQLSEQRDRLVQSERVAAWRELARRLAHELKNPLFPLQITVENLVRSRALPPQEFDEVFSESARTLAAEIDNLKNIIGRFSDFSKMPKPQLQEVDIQQVMRRVAELYQPALAQREPPIGLRLECEEQPLLVSADPDLLHRALSNLVLNAMDAMPAGGAVTMCGRRRENFVQIRVSDNGAGLTPEECARLFTPYYTTKQHGTGLGLAIVQSVISDHGGTIAVQSTPGGGATFVIELPALAVAQEAHA